MNIYFDMLQRLACCVEFSAYRTESWCHITICIQTANDEVSLLTSLVLILNLSAAANAAPVFFKYNLIPVICILERVMKSVGGFSAAEGLHLVTSLVKVQEQIYLIDIIIDYKNIQIPNFAFLLAKHFYTVC